MKIIEHFRSHENVRFTVLSNKSQAPVIAKAQALDVDTVTFDRRDFYETCAVLDYLQSTEVSLVVLAGFLWLIPPEIIQAFPQRIINIHPALLPKFGGKGMYGHRVHDAVIEAGEKESGITIHFVDEEYDHGQVILQEKCKVEKGDTPDMLAKKIQQLEHRYFPKTVASLIK